MVPPSSLWPFQRESHPLPSYYFLKIVSDIFILNKKRAGELQKPFPTRSRIASEAPLSFSTSSHPALNRFLWKLYSAFQPAFLLTFAQISLQPCHLSGNLMQHFSQNGNFFPGIFPENNLFTEIHRTSLSVKTQYFNSLNTISKETKSKSMLISFQRNPYFHGV